MTVTLHHLFVKQFNLCAVREGELVGVIAESDQKSQYVEAAVAAARSMGAATVVLMASSLSQPVLPPVKSRADKEVRALLLAAGACDLIVDVTVGGLIHSEVRTQIIGNGHRMLFVAEPADVLERLQGTLELKDRVEEAGRILKLGRRIHVTSEAGTDLTADISGEDLPTTRQWGFVDQPARWDHWPSGFIACFPRDRTARGVIVLAPADVLLPWQRYVREPVRLEIESGYIRRIDGEGGDAANLRDYFESWGDPEVYATSHMGWGLHHSARWSALEVYDPRTLYGQELRSVAGNFMWSTGSNRFANRETPAHLDIPMRGCTVRVDDTVVVRDGKLV
jgi:2,5-dihydroxypyridine 5,6-dioxygenase